MTSSIMGTYVLALWLGRPRTLVIGRLGAFEFPSGWFLYVGSALGPGGLRARVQRHWRYPTSGKRAHWHIDYLRKQAIWGGVWGRASGPGEPDQALVGQSAPNQALVGQSAPDQGTECRWAALLRLLPQARVVAPGFGASDCRCPAHLVHVTDLPAEEWFASTLGAERILMDTDHVEELLDVLISGDEDSREAAALALGRFGTVAAERLVPLLSHEDSEVRWWAARALAEVGRDGGPPLLEGILNDPDPDVRACAALALGRIGEGAAAQALADQLGDESAFVSSIASDALSMIGDAAVEALAEKLTDDDPHVRLLAVRALSRIKSQSTIGPLFGALEDSSYLVRHYAQEALEALGVGMVYLRP
jgi:Uri superfamily endonuclease